LDWGEVARFDTALLNHNMRNGYLDALCHSKASAAQVLCKPLDKTLTLAAASRLAAKVVGDHLPSGLGRGQAPRAGVMSD